MTNSNDDNQNESASVDAAFTNLVSSLPDLAALDPHDPSSAVELVEIVVPDPNGSGESARITFEVPAEIAPLLRAELSPQRIAAMSQAITAMATLMAAPSRPGPNNLGRPDSPHD